MLNWLTILIHPLTAKHRLQTKLKFSNEHLSKNCKFSHYYQLYSISDAGDFTETVPVLSFRVSDYMRLMLQFLFPTPIWQ